MLLGRGYKLSMLKEVIEAAKSMNREKTLVRTD